MAQIDYFEDEGQHGNYQYVSMEEIINNFKMSSDIDDYTSNLPRYKLLYHAKKGLQQLYYDVLREIKVAELELSPSLSMVVPPDFVSYVRISWVDDNGQLHPMAVDRKQNIAKAYLQDHEYELLFDNEGCPLKSDVQVGNTPTPEDRNTYENDHHRTYNLCKGFDPNTDLSRVFENGKYRFDKTNGVFYFGSDSFSKNIVLEYISDGLYTDSCEGSEEDIRVHKFAELALIDYMYYASIKQRRNVPANEKARARKEFYNSMRLSKRRINSINKKELLQVLRADSVWVKQS